MSGDDVDLTLGLMDLGLDSLTIVEVGGKLGAQLGLTLNPREFFEEPSVQRLAASLLGRPRAARGRPLRRGRRPFGRAGAHPLLRADHAGLPGGRARGPGSADVADVVVDEALADDVEALDRLAAEPGAAFVHVARHPFTAIERSPLPQREAEERWATANGNLIDLAERVGPAALRRRALRGLGRGARRRGGRRGRAPRPSPPLRRRPAGGPRPVRSHRLDRVTLAQRPGRSVRVVADELGYDVTWPPPGRGGPPPAPVPPPPEAPAVPLAPSGPAAPAEAEAAPPIVPISRELPLEVSSAQEQLLFVDDLQPGLAIYNLPTAARLRGPLDVAALESAFSEIVRRHEALRTNYEVQDGRYVQVVAKPVPVFLGFEDLRAGARPSSASTVMRERIGSRGGAPVRPAVRSQDPRPVAPDGRRRARADHDHAPHRVGRRLDRHLRRRAGRALRGVCPRRGPDPRPAAGAVRRLRRLAARAPDLQRVPPAARVLGRAARRRAARARRPRRPAPFTRPAPSPAAR